MTTATRLRELELSLGYATDDDDLVRDFYVPCLSVASEYRRAVGYFSGALFILVGLAFSDFVRRGGKTRLVCSPSLTAQDIESLTKGYETRDVVGSRTLEDVRNLIASSNGKPVAQFLASLVACGALDVRIAYRPTRVGIFHQKIGVFVDSFGDQVSFTGSANETFSAWDIEGNSESFDVFESWVSGNCNRVKRHAKYFDRLWAGDIKCLAVRSFPDAARDHLLSARTYLEIDEAAANFRHFVVGARKPPVVRDKPKPAGRALQPHQAAVLQNWRAADFRGIVAHVTGAGKTVTALHAVRDWLTKTGPVLILVPSELLLEQWSKEITRELIDLQPSLITVGGGADRGSWEELIADMTRDMRELGHRITLATIQTACKESFTSRVKGGSHLLVVADEVHRVGSHGFKGVLDIDARGRLGLSATPERYGDFDGTQRIKAYFGERLQPPFGIPEAVAAGRLVPYDYYVHELRLEDTEQQEWDQLTERLRREFAKLPKDATGAKIHSNLFRLLLFKRASILKQANGKIELAAKVLQENFHAGDRWLVYCDSQVQLALVSRAIQTLGLTVLEYHSAMSSDREAAMNYFEGHEGVMTAIRCLDEGVDIPAVNKALILASSQNSREFIQRRGRVLRSSPGKFSAEVHDCLVLPLKGAGDKGAEVAIVRTELRRAAEFAAHARNQSVGLQLAITARREGIDDFDVAVANVEDDDT